MLKIAIILGSTRPGRFCDHPANWIAGHVARRDDMQAVVLDPKDFPLPFYEELTAPVFNGGKYANPIAEKWAAHIAEADGIIIVTPEYNHSFTAVLKNLLDHAYHEYAQKPVAFVGYGGVGGARAVEQLRLVAVEFQMAPIKTAVHIPVQAYLAVAQEGKALDSFDYLETSAVTMLDQLAWWTGALKAARAA